MSAHGVSASRLSGRRILVTGGTGFIGGRVVERLCQDHDCVVRVLVRTFANATKIARYPVEMVAGDITRPDDVKAAARECDLVIHCAYGNRGDEETRRRVNVDGTRHVLDAASAAGVERVVHLSTVMVYGIAPDGGLDESAPRRPTGDSYADTKLEAELLVEGYGAEHGLEVSVLQPTVVYGPYAPAWTERVIGLMRKKRVPLVNGGDGLCNPVYIDDVVTAILLAATRDGAAGERFLVAGDAPVTWREFFGRFEGMLGRDATVSMSEEEARRRFRSTGPASVFGEGLRILREEKAVRKRVLATREMKVFRSVFERVTPESFRDWLRGRLRHAGNGADERGEPRRPLHELPPDMIDFYASKPRVKIAKARDELGYRPSFTFDVGMELTAKWADWANLT